MTWSDKGRRIAVVRKMYAWRLGEVLPQARLAGQPVQAHDGGPARRGPLQHVEGESPHPDPPRSGLHPGVTA